MRDFVYNTVEVLGTDQGDDFHTTAVSERFYGGDKFDAIMTGFVPDGVLADSLFSADFFLRR